MSILSTKISAKEAVSINGMYSLMYNIQGITIKPLVKLIKVKKDREQKPTMNEVIHGTVSIFGWYYQFLFLCVYMHRS